MAEKPGHTVSVKGVLVDAGRVLLLRNDRAEWELPGGQLEAGEQPPDTLARELLEETGLAVSVGDLLHTQNFEVVPGRWVLILTYAATPASIGPPGQPRISAEHVAGRWFAIGDALWLDDLPDVYKAGLRAFRGLP